MKTIEIYDTTLRDGAQTEGILFSLQDKLRIARKIDELGIHYIEGGMPGANPKDTEFFRAVRRWKRRSAEIAAFGATCRPHTKPESDPVIQTLLKSHPDVITIVGKSWDLHVRMVLGTTEKENLRMIRDTIAFLTGSGYRVFFDAEHFFDGCESNMRYALETVCAAVEGGAERVVLCDTNGGMLPGEVREIVVAVRNTIKIPLGIHTHNDGGLAVANTIAAVEAGVVQVQGTINGYGERCGNADLCALLPNLVLKMNLPAIGKNKLRKLSSVAHFVSEVANMPHPWSSPYTGNSAFAHKSGIHVNAVRKEPRTYEHIAPSLVGNMRRLLVSEQSGKSNVLHIAEQMGIHLKDKQVVQSVLRQLKELEFDGYQFEGAEGSFEILLRKNIGRHKRFFELQGFRVVVDKRRGREIFSEATIRIKVADHEEMAVAEGDGPVNALDNALRKVLERFYPSLSEMHLTDYKVRVLDAVHGTAAKVRVLITSADHATTWSTVGVSTNVIQASWKALVDSIEYKLLKDIEKSDK
ncbi:MAG: citramalate synthase [bacterium]